MSNQPPADMSIKLGGRVFQPALPVVDGALPTNIELGFNTSLLAYSNENIALESVDGIVRRERVLDRMGTLCRDWIKSVFLQKGYPLDVAQSAGGQLFTSGSYRLGVHEPGADIDTILVAPSVCRRTDFFGTVNVSDENPIRDPNSLAERIRAHPDVTNFSPVEGAAVPLLTFDWEGINIDLLFARLNTNSVPVDFDVDNDIVLDGADSATEKSLNGPRVTNLIAAFVGGTPERYQSFLTVVRCVRKWAKARGLYSNKMGYWGGVNINIGVALTVQLYPNACPASILRKFFLVFKTWRWPQPLMLTKPHDAGYGLQVWSQQQSARQVAPMITPAYPAMNSTLAVSRQTLQIMQDEFHRAHEILDQLWKEYQRDPSADMKWGKLFAPSDFFISYPRYLSLCIVAPTQQDAQSWTGFVESRLRKLVSDLLARSLPIKKIQLLPKKFEACVADKTALLTQAQRQNCVTYFIGLQVDMNRMRGGQLNVEMQMQNFREWDLSRFQPLSSGMDILVRTFKVKDLPRICFEGFYPEGKMEAMLKRRQLRDSDPVRQEKKKMARLEELKAKMAEIHRKKEEQQDRKRKRELEEEEEEAAKQVKQENASVDDGTQDESPVENDEAVLLVSALGAQSNIDDDVDVNSQQPDDGVDVVDEPNEDGYESDENAVGYTKDEVRQVKLQKVVKEGEEDVKGKQSKLDVPDDVKEALKKLGYNIVSDDETILLGANMIPPWRNRSMLSNSGDANAPSSNSSKNTFPSYIKVQFRDKFDMVELDAFGHVIDTGDDDYKPSKSWIGRKDGFEFKLGERGLGYYRTGKKVVVPSNIAY